MPAVDETLTIAPAPRCAHRRASDRLSGADGAHHVQLPGRSQISSLSSSKRRILGGLFNPIQPYLPYTAATTLAGTQLGRAAFGPANGAASTATALPFAAAAALLAALAIALSALAARTTVPRDIT